jgi:hypothetical protein
VAAVVVPTLVEQRVLEELAAAVQAAFPTPQQV